MKRLILSLVLLLGCAALSSAQSSLVSGFSEKLASSGASFDYSFKVKTSATVTGSGSVTYADGRYKMLGNGLEVWCDGRSRWTVDHAAKELYIESVEDAGTDFMGNPALLLQAVGTVFTQSSQKSSSFNGKSATQVTLIPSVSGTGLKSVSLYFNSESIPVGAMVVTEDGTSASITLSSFKFAAQASGSFSFDAGKLDKSYLVTDLR
ncbi:MAG: outer membrane lipoprotein carrier protein LolA [Bacteroidales bacterium]|nr:outer membrane lipoprotein carrier protein LolA [Candidatus Cryptobacteroides onthequi]MCQ2163917.1 outer membrane lipoprotein carrier protein LolA [Bacteroidales bacterium]